MSRCAFLSAGGDVLLLNLAIHFFKNVWQDEVDKMYICYNGIIEPKVLEFAKKIAVHPKIEFLYVPYPLGFGLPFTTCFNASKEDLILLLEDDGYIYKKGLVDECFKLIESGEYDMVGSPRRSCSDGIWNKSKEKYNLDYSGIDDVGPNFWPNFFFCKRSDLLKTTLDFGGHGWAKGEYVKELDFTAENEEAGDTFVWISMQLRALGLKAKTFNQCHAMPEEIEEYNKKFRNWQGQPFGWIHAGSLSSGWNGFLDGKYTPTPEGYGLQELETRVAFWTIASDIEPFDEIKEFKDKYVAGIIAMIEHYNLDTTRIRKKMNIYKQLLRL